MSSLTIQDILPLVETPSRYLGCEQNHIKKAHSKVKLKFALAFPELYEIGTSHFGIQILYHIINKHPDFLAERIFCPAADMKAHLKTHNLPLTSLETQSPIAAFDIIGFSLLYELNYTNVLSMLDLGKIPFLSSQRDLSHPFIIAGGPCTCNPEPVADIFDAMVIGDGETVILDMLRIWTEWKTGSADDRNALLTAWSGLDGIYIPQFYKPVYDFNRFQQFVSSASTKKNINRAIVPDLNKASFPDHPIVAFGKPVHDRLRLEVSRGCTRGCRFCQAGMIYRPVRERTPETIFSLSRTALLSTGYQDISLLSLSTGDYRQIGPLVRRLMEHCEGEHTSISLPSLRAGTLSPELIRQIKKVRKTGFTIAPEAGSQRLRDLINKGITEKDVVSTVKDACLLGWQVIKLYFMVGFPTETGEDLQAIVDLVNQLRRIRGSSSRKIKINVSVATFIPKPHTPFQWASQIPLEESREKIRWLKDHLKLPGVQFKWQNPEVSMLEGLWARGDRKLNMLLTTAYRNGCEFDGWSDTFNYDAWIAAIRSTDIDPDFYTTRKRDPEEVLPWDHIHIGVSKSFLQKEWQKAFTGESTPDCRDGDCQGCGVCDFKKIAPRVYNRFEENQNRAKRKNTLSIKIPTYQSIKVTYCKLDQARFFGHLEMANLICRALRCAQIPVKFSEGFHPKPKISFEDPLPIGIESRCETLYLQILDRINPKKIPDRLNDYLPPGLRVLESKPVPSARQQNPPRSMEYMVEGLEGTFDKRKLDQFIETNPFRVTRTNRKGKSRTIDLKEVVSGITMLSPGRMRISLRPVQGITLRPHDILGPVFFIPQEILKTIRIIKIDTKH